MDLFLLKGFAADQALVVARRAPDTKLDLAHKDVQSFIQFTDRVEQLALGGECPTVDELRTSGRA
jgi:hypothetical protein